MGLDKAWLGRHMGRLALLLLALGMVVPYVVGRVSTQHFPSLSDQDGYLSAASRASQGQGLQHRAPLYSAFLALHFLGERRSAEEAFHNERVFEILALAVALGVLMGLLLGFESGVAAGCLASHSRYLLMEPNGSHVFAVLWWLAGLIVLVIGGGRGRPLAAFLFFSSGFARSELWLAAGPAILVLCFDDFRDRKGRCQPALSRGWTTAAVAASAVALLLPLASAEPEQSRFAVAYQQNFSVRYVEMNDLGDRYRHAWVEVDEIWASIHGPNVGVVAGVFREPLLHARRLLAEVVTSFRAVPATILALDDPAAPLAIALLSLALSLLLRRNDLQTTESMRDRLRPLMAAMGLLVLIPVSWIFRSAARYYLPLLPVGQGILVGLIWSAAWTLVRRLQPGGSPKPIL
jgi:hypothetical protein